MIVILSPAKTFSKNVFPFETTPRYLNLSITLINKLKKLSIKALQSSMKISEDLAKKVKVDYAQFNEFPRCAIFAYDGYAFKGFQAETLSKDQLNYVKDHLIILSGLYGIVKPFDGITPYRLDIKDKTVTNLYHYWDKPINTYLDNLDSDELIINLASNEYSKLIDSNLKMITIGFSHADKRLSNMELKHIRGKAARYLMEHPVSSLKELQNIQFEGFKYDSQTSTLTHFYYILEDTL